ncbi:ECF transporter S component [Acetobacterium paludosum]|uniref:ECF transporter S component n=1 Tax=Acetobacterium paludosum TaxID=52693 RepID=A0A923KPC9_9FIRM|nr:ECF transporter S component [Acetobacterium paludosum]MBC3888019.1 ECF transporter S component [Acetobacterium paludosum]
MKITTKQLVFTALLIALSFIGAQLKIFGTIAFDSLPAYLGTFLMGPIFGAIIGIIGHLLTAATSGFPMTLPVHCVIALGMGLTMVGTWYTYLFVKKIANETLGLLISVIAATIFNGPILLLLCSPLLVPILTWAGVIALMLPLALVGGLNALIAAVIYKALPDSIKNQF